MRSRVFLVVAVLGCGSETTKPEPAPAAQVQVVSGHDQIGVVHSVLGEPVVAKILDEKGLPVVGQLVNFVVVKGGGSVFAGSALSTTLGEVRERWTLGDTSGIQALEVRAVNQITGAPLVFARVEATAEPAAVDTLFVALTDTTVFVGQKLALSPMITRMRDRYGNDASSKPVSISVSSGWTRNGDTISTDGERRGTATFMAGSQTRTVNLLALENLRPFSWQISFACLGPMRVTSDPSSAQIDSVRVTGTLADVYYRGDVGFRTDIASTHNVQFAGSTERVRFFASGVTDTLVQSRREIFTQKPDTLAAYGGTLGWLLRSPSVPRRYEGGDFCTQVFTTHGTVSMLRPVVLLGEPK